MLWRLLNLDRKVIFLLVLAAAGIPLFFPLNIGIKPSQPVKNIYNFIEKLPPGKNILISFDYGPSTRIECAPMAAAVMRHAFRRGLRVVGLTVWPEGAALASDLLKRIGKECGKKYGQDYLDLGYKPGNEMAILALSKGIQTICPRDAAGTPIEEFPILSGIRTLRDFDLILSFSGGFPGLTDWITIAQAQCHRPVAGGCTAVIASQLYPYINSGQLLGLMGGLKGAAEYETLIGHPEEACLAMDAQGVTHFLIAGLILLSNLVFFATRKKKKIKGGV
ncbi:MAG: hypothetical protein V2A78_07595 [bacterium]